MELGKEIGWIRPKNTDGGEYDDSLIKSQIKTLDEELDKVQDDMRQDISNKADKSEIPTKTSQLNNDSGFLTNIPSEYVTEGELNAKGYLTNTNFSLGVHSDGGIYLFVNGEPVGMGIFISNADISSSAAYIAADNIIMLSDNLPSGIYTMKYENEDGSYSIIGDFEI